MPRTQQAVELRVGPFTGVYDSPDTGTARRNRLFDARNLTIPDPREGSAAVARHGFLGLTNRLGSSSERTGQGLYEHRRLNNRIDRLMFCGGRMYRWNGNAIADDITPAGIDIHISNPIFCASYNDLVIISDENNKPWIYDPALETGTVIELNDAGDNWATKGGPIVYGGVVFFILRGSGSAYLITEDEVDRISTELTENITTELTSGVQNTLIWSEPLDPAVGYSQGDYDNVWQLTQTSNEILGMIIGEESRLVYYRNKGIGHLSGPVDENFRGSATRDSGGATVGTDAPAAGMSVNGRHFFVDVEGRVYKYIPGAGEPTQLWYPLRRTAEGFAGVAGNRATVVEQARVGFHAQYNLVLFTIWDRQTIYCFDVESGRYVGTWRINGGIHVDAMGSLVDDENRTTFIILGSRTSTRDDDTMGVIWRQKHADDANQWLDQADADVASYAALDILLETHWLTSDIAEQFRLTDVAAGLLSDTSRHAVRLQYNVPDSGESSAITAQSTAAAASTTVSKAEWSLGRNAQGPAVRLKLTVTHSDNVRFGINSLVAEGVVTRARAA